MAIDWRNHAVATSLSALVAVALLGGAPFWWKFTPWGSGGDRSDDIMGVIRLQGGCAPFIVYAQNRWLPYGAAIRTAPSVTSKQIASRDPNQAIPVDGWVHSGVAYPTNTPPWNNDVWFHLADGAGWVAFAGVRAQPVPQDPTGLGDGGPPAALDSGCQGSAQ